MDNNNHISKIKILTSGKYVIKYNTLIKLSVSIPDVRTKRFNGQINYKIYLEIYTQIIKQYIYILILKNFQELFAEPEKSKVLVID